MMSDSLFESLIKLYAGTAITYPKLKAITIAQWANESGRGTSPLATEHYNFAGLKWRPEMENFATKVRYKPLTEIEEDYCKFASLEAFIRGYWHFLSRDVYKGLEEHTSDEEDFIRFLGLRKYNPSPDYPDRILRLLPEARNLLAAAQRDNDRLETRLELLNDGTIVGRNKRSPLWKHQSSGAISELKRVLALTTAESFAALTDQTTLPPELPAWSESLYGEEQPTTPTRPTQPTPSPAQPLSKPAIREFIESPNRGRRPANTRIRRIILHYTTSRNVRGTIAEFLNSSRFDRDGNPRMRTSSHYIVDRNGDIYQMVRDAEMASHALHHNADSIGIEHCAEPGDELTPQQTQATVRLIKWLMAEYNIPRSGITGHKFTGRNTSCPGDLFGPPTLAAMNAWIDRHFS